MDMYMEGWRVGGLEGWRVGGIEGLRDGGMEGWRDGGMEGWRDGGMEGRRDGGMEGRRNGGRYELRTCLFCLASQTIGGNGARVRHKYFCRRRFLVTTIVAHRICDCQSYQERRKKNRVRNFFEEGSSDKVQFLKLEHVSTLK
jgi:hypothetical protein